MTISIEGRQTWGATPARGGLTALAYPVVDVYLHHEAGPLSPANLTVEQERAKMRELQQEFFAKGYSDFAYGVAVFGSGRAYEGRDLGFVCGGMTAEEAATLGHNSDSVAIVWPGNFMIQVPTAAQLQSTADVIAIAQLAGVVVLAPHLWGHRDTAFATACPGDHAYAALPQLRTLVAQHGNPPPGPKVPHMFDPPIALAHPDGGAWIARSDGVVYFVGPAGLIRGGMVTPSDRAAFGNRTVKELRPRMYAGGAKHGYTIVATDGATYVPEGQR